MYWTIHVTSISHIFKTCNRSLSQLFWIILLIIFTIKSKITGFFMKSLVIYSTFSSAIPYLMTNTANSQFFFLNTFLTITLYILIKLIIGFENFPYLDNQSVSIFDIIVNIDLFIFLFCQKPAFNQIFFVFYWLN